MQLNVTAVLEKPGLVSRLGGFFHDSRVVTQPLLEHDNATLRLQRYGYEYPAPLESRWLGLVKWRLYPWVPCNIVVSRVAALRVVVTEENPADFGNDISAITLEGPDLVFWCAFNEVHLTLCAESTMLITDTGAPLTTGVRVFGANGLRLDGIEDLLAASTL